MFASVLLGLILCSSASGSPTGWLGDGSATWPRSTVMSPLTASWSTDLPWSNASPVVVGDRVFVTVEPTGLAALDAHSGEVLWRHSHPVLGALSGADRASWEPRLARAEELEAELVRLQAEYSRLQREVRRSSIVSEADLESVSSTLSTTRAQLDALAPYRTPADKDIIGYASPTPVVADGVVYAVFGNGVVAAHAADGSVLWQRWLGPPPTKMLGYDFGVTASPRLAAGRLIIGYRTLLALDPATGEPVWESDAYPHYGTVAVASVGDEQWVVTPDGRALDAATGAPRANGLGESWYIGPTVRDDQVATITGASDSSNRSDGVTVRLSTLSAAGAASQWSVKLSVSSAIYAPALLIGKRMILVSRKGMLIVLDLADGSVIHEVDLPIRVGDVYPSPSLVGGRIAVFSDAGEAVWLDPTTFEVLATDLVPGGRATGAFTASGAWFRALDRVWAVTQTP